MSYSIAYHGRYCGPGWSDGKYQPSVSSGQTPIDEFDSTCAAHDAVYSMTADSSALTEADYHFFRQNCCLEPKRLLAAALVGAQGALRGLDSSITNTTMQKRLRGSAPKQPKTAAKAAPKNPKSSVTLSTVPAAYGFSLKMAPPKVSRRGDVSIISGSDFAGSVMTQNTANYQPGSSVLLNPVYFQNAMLGSQARAYEKFRFTRAIIEYIPSVPTSVQGQLVMCVSRTVKEPFFDGSSSTFLSRALSQGNAIATPLWKETYLEVPCDGEWNVVDTLLDGDLDDSIQNEVQCYTFAATTSTSGILMLHYTIEFKDPLYTYHPTLIPVPMGNGAYGTLVDAAAANAVNSAVLLNNSIGLSFSAGAGSVYRLIFRQEASTLPAGPTNWANVAAVETTNATNSSSFATAFTSISLTDGTTLYGLFNNGVVALYTSYEGAVAGINSDLVVHNTATTTAGTWAFIGALVRIGSALRVTSQ